MQNYYYTLRCFMIDFWDHSLGECQVSMDNNIERAIYQAAETNISSSLGSRVITDLPRCLRLTVGGQICWVHSVRGEEIADPDPRVRQAEAAAATALTVQLNCTMQCWVGTQIADMKITSNLPIANSCGKVQLFLQCRPTGEAGVQHQVGSSSGGSGSCHNHCWQ
jgi:hypothetical protein